MLLLIATDMDDEPAIVYSLANELLIIIITIDINIYINMNDAMIISYSLWLLIETERRRIKEALYNINVLMNSNSL